jgi:hypothetical protein
MGGYRRTSSQEKVIPESIQGERGVSSRTGVDFSRLLTDEYHYAMFAMEDS